MINKYINFIRKALLILLVFNFIVIFFVSFSSSLTFYDGNIKVSMIKSDIYLEGNKIFVNSSYTFKNDGLKSETVNLTFNDYKNYNIYGDISNGQITLDYGESRTLIVSYQENLNENNGFSLDSEVLINGLIPSKRIDNFISNIFIHEEGKSISSSTLNFIETSSEGRKVYSYQEVNVYPKLINFNVIDYKFNLYVVRSNSKFSNIGDIINVKVSLQNFGDQKIDNLLLVDSFLESNFKPEDMNGFEYVSLPNEPYYKFTKEIGSLEPKESKEYVYSLKVKSLDNLRLNPLKIFSGNVLVSSVEGSNIQQSYTESSLPLVNSINSRPFVENAIKNIKDDSNEIPSDVNMEELKREIDNYKFIKQRNIFLIIFSIIIFIGIILLIYNYIKKRRPLKVFVREDVKNE